MGGFYHTRGARLFGLLWCSVRVLTVQYSWRGNEDGTGGDGMAEILDEVDANPGGPEAWALTGSLGHGDSRFPDLANILSYLYLQARLSS
jgi:hypothetical protein